MILNSRWLKYQAPCQQALLYCFTNQSQKGSLSYSHQAKEFIDPDHVIQQKVELLAHFINTSKYPIFFTGAGISTSLGIPDYRSGQDTILNTGPGLWNRSEEEMRKLHNNRHTFIDLLTPSITHMAIYTLIKENVFKHVVSQNTDGLHLRSGIKKSQLSQLHGNRNLQFCIKCQRKYLRDFRAIKKTQKFFKPGEKRDHITGRSCENCGGQLHDSIIYFGEKLPRQEIARGYKQGAKADLCLTLGSSLTVRPSSNIPLLPLKYDDQGKLVIINIQQTGLDRNSALKINGFCDHVMEKLMDKLGIKISSFKVQRYLEISVQKQYDHWVLHVTGIDEKHANYSFIKSVNVYNKKKSVQNQSNFEVKQYQENNQNTVNEQKQQDLYNQQGYILRSNLTLNLFSHDYETFQQIDLKVNFFNPFPPLLLNLYSLLEVHDIIGQEKINLKILSKNNQHWQITKLKR